jgi:hypothetical protein
MKVLRGVVGLAWLVVFGHGAAANCVAQDVVAKKPIEQLIAELDSKDFKIREAATASLWTCESALPALWRARASESEEVRCRVALLLEELLNKRARGMVGLLLSDRKKAKIDAALDSVIVAPGPKGKEAWGVLVQVAQGVARELGNTFDFPIARSVGSNLTDFAQPSFRAESPLQLEGVRVRAREVIAEEEFHTSVILCRGNIKAGGFSDCLVLANGDVMAKYGVRDSLISHSFVFCNGNVEVGVVHNSVIVATGAVKVKCIGANGRVVAGLENVRKFFGLFDSKDVGAELKVDQRAVRVAKLEPGSMLDVAGLRSGDVVCACDNVKITSVEGFTRCLRGCVVEGSTMELEVMRGQEKLAFKIVP